MMWGTSPKWWETTTSKNSIREAFEAGFKAGQVCGNGLEVAYKEFKQQNEAS